MIFYRMHRVRTTTKTVRYRRWGPKPRTRIWNQLNRLDSDIKYYYELIYPNWDRGEKRCLNHFIHQFFTRTHWIIFSILLILSINTINNLFYLSYIHIIVIWWVLCIRYNPSVFSHSPTYTDHWSPVSICHHHATPSCWCTGTIKNVSVEIKDACAEIKDACAGNACIDACARWNTCTAFTYILDLCSCT